ncbi:hypothetical protein E3N88_38821 [Mikania micrantha]|uniref:Uncharacterized protein n=1 Tax=Mikania micrantha TaxID=192012 RepID=A0A5N6LV21_9ASTR|nr:hypothetical protein E3N88_38821 [Mikania micrantha]
MPIFINFTFGFVIINFTTNKEQETEKLEEKEEEMGLQINAQHLSYVVHVMGVTVKIEFGCMETCRNTANAGPAPLEQQHEEIQINHDAHEQKKGLSTIGSDLVMYMDLYSGVVD